MLEKGGYCYSLEFVFRELYNVSNPRNKNKLVMSPTAYRSYKKTKKDMRILTKEVRKDVAESHPGLMDEDPLSVVSQMSQYAAQDLKQQIASSTSQQGESSSDDERTVITAGPNCHPMIICLPTIQTEVILLQLTNTGVQEFFYWCAPKKVDVVQLTDTGTSGNAASISAETIDYQPAENSSDTDTMNILSTPLSDLHSTRGTHEVNPDTTGHTGVKSEENMGQGTSSSGPAQMEVDTKKVVNTSDDSLLLNVSFKRPISDISTSQESLLLRESAEGPPVVKRRASTRPTGINIGMSGLDTIKKTYTVDTDTKTSEESDRADDGSTEQNPASATSTAGTAIPSMQVTVAMQEHEVAAGQSTAADSAKQKTPPRILNPSIPLAGSPM